MQALSFPFQSRQAFHPTLSTRHLLAPVRVSHSHADWQEAYIPSDRRDRGP